MIRVDRKELARSEIIRCAAKFFMQDGYSKTTFRAMGKALNMSTGNMTFYFQTKEHLLAELVDILCKFQWKRMEEEAREGYSSVMAICLELLTIASACEQDEVAKDFFISTYTSPVCLEIIRRNDKERAKEVFGQYCTGWNDEHKHVIEYSLKLDSNPEFTSSVLVACARAAYRMYKEGQHGCKTIFDVAPSYLHPESGKNLRKKLL